MAVSSAISVPSEMMPTPLAMALAVMGWSPVTIITCVGEGGKRSRIILREFWTLCLSPHNLTGHRLHPTSELVAQPQGLAVLCLHPLGLGQEHWTRKPRTVWALGFSGTNWGFGHITLFRISLDLLQKPAGFFKLKRQTPTQRTNGNKGTSGMSRLPQQNATQAQVHADPHSSSLCLFLRSTLPSPGPAVHGCLGPAPALSPSLPKGLAPELSGILFHLYVST